MDNYHHHVSGIFSRREDADKAYASLVVRGLPRARLQIFETDTSLPSTSQQTKSNEVLKDMVVDGAIGTAVGSGIGALAGVALVAANVTLFIASPVVATLALLGWGASLGGMVGATVGSAESSTIKSGMLSDLIKDAIESGQVVLVAETLTKQETDNARDVMKISVNDYHDINTA